MTEGFFMDYEERLQMQSSEIASLKEELDRERIRREAAENTTQAQNNLIQVLREKIKSESNPYEL
jgi:hypothetical protein